ncbi:hypothetical protein GCM10027269_32190 [Kribbella endophytica]
MPGGRCGGGLKGAEGNGSAGHGEAREHGDGTTDELRTNAHDFLISPRMERIPVNPTPEETPAPREKLC